MFCVLCVVEFGNGLRCFKPEASPFIVPFPKTLWPLRTVGPGGLVTFDTWRSLLCCLQDRRFIEFCVGALKAHPRLAAALLPSRFGRLRMPCDGLPLGATSHELSKRGWELQKSRNFKAALACHEQATKESDSNEYTWFHRANTEVALNRAKAAKKSFERALSGNIVLEPQAATEAHFQLARIARESGDLLGAEREYVKSIELQPSASGAHVMLGVTLRELERIDEAIAAYETGLTINPSISAAQFNYGQCLILRERRAEAMHTFRLAVKLDPEFAQGYHTLGDEFSAAGRYEEALASYRQMLRSEPQSSLAYYSMGKVPSAVCKCPTCHARCALCA